jgi:CheY-like chemotaxis protein
MFILVVDDNPNVREYIAAVFQERGHSVAKAADGQEALDAIVGSQFDAVLMDLSMPSMTGVEATRELRKDPRHAELPIFAFTGMSDLEGFDAQLFTRTFLKPYPPMALIEAIEAEIAKRIALRL